MAVVDATLLAVEANAAALAELLDELTRWTTDTWGKAWREGAHVLAAWSDAWVDIAEASAAASARAPSFRLSNLDAARREVERMLAATMDDNATRTLATMADAVVMSDPHQRAMVRTQLPYTVSARAWAPTNPDAIAAIIDRTTRHITARHYYLNAEAKRAVRQALRVGVAAGDNPRAVARDMIRRTGGVFEGGRNRADVIARTEILDAYRAANHAAWDRNADLLSGWQWWAELSDRTCPSCVQNHGTLHPTDEPGPIDHHRGRCTGIPVLKSWRSLGFRDAGNEPGSALKPGDGVAWFEAQPPGVQRQIMGPRRFDAYQRGDYPPGSWSHRVETDGWRDAMHTTPAPSARG